MIINVQINDKKLLNMWSCPVSAWILFAFFGLMWSSLLVYCIVWCVLWYGFVSKLDSSLMSLYWTRVQIVFSPVLNLLILLVWFILIGSIWLFFIFAVCYNEFTWTGVSLLMWEFFSFFVSFTSRISFNRSLVFFSSKFPYFGVPSILNSSFWFIFW